jgi:hypothetical protein
VSTAEGAGEKQIGDVGTGDEEDKSDGAEEGEEDPAYPVGDGLFVEALNADAGIAIGVGELRGEAAGEAAGMDCQNWVSDGKAMPLGMTPITVEGTELT